MMDNINKKVNIAIDIILTYAMRFAASGYSSSDSDTLKIFMKDFLKCIEWNYNVGNCPKQELCEFCFEYNIYGSNTTYPVLELLYINDETGELSYPTGDPFDDASINDVIAWRFAYLPSGFGQRKERKCL